MRPNLNKLNSKINIKVPIYAVFHSIFEGEVEARALEDVFPSNIEASERIDQMVEDILKDPLSSCFDIKANVLKNGLELNFYNLGEFIKTETFEIMVKEMRVNPNELKWDWNF